jgi:hypothetical protein
MQQIKTFEDACLKLGKNPKGKYHPYERLEIIVAAIVGKWKADYNNDDQEKWYCVFRWDASSSCFRFDCSFYGYTNANAGSGVRLSLQNDKQADYVGKTFEAEFNALLQRK